MEFRIRQAIAYCQPLPAYWQSQLLCTYCQLHIAYCVLTSEHVWKKLSKYRYWGLIILLHLHHYLIQKMIFLLETFKFNHCKNKVPSPPSEFSKKHIIYDTMEKRKIPNTPTHFFWNKFWIHKCIYIIFLTTAFLFFFYSCMHRNENIVNSQQPI